MTQLTKAALDVLYGDAVPDASISPATARNLIDSLIPSHGSIHFADSVTPTNIVAPGAFVKASNAGTLGDARRFSMSDVGRLRYDGITSVQGRIVFTGTLTAAIAAQTAKLAIGLNGTPIVASYMRTRTGVDPQAIALVVDLVIAPGDYFEIFVMNETSAEDVTIEHGYLNAIAFLI